MKKHGILWGIGGVAVGLMAAGAMLGAAGGDMMGMSLSHGKKRHHSKHSSGSKRMSRGSAAGIAHVVRHECGLCSDEYK